MRAQQIVELGGPAAMSLVEVDEPRAGHFSTPGQGVLIQVAAVGLSFPDVLQSRGAYQFTPPLPYIPGGEVVGTVLSSTDSRFTFGERVMAIPTIGGLAERVIAPAALTFPVHMALSDHQGAALPVNYRTALFGLKRRGRIRAGEWVLVHGAAGGVGSAALQIAKGLAARTIAVVSDARKATVAAHAGADVVLRSDKPWKDQAREITYGGVDVVVDPVGGDRVLDSLRSLRHGGRLIVLGFADGTIPAVKLNRLLLRNVEIVGAGLGAWLSEEPDLSRELAEELDGLIDAGYVAPIVGATLSFEQAAIGLRLLEERKAVGKVVVDLRQRREPTSETTAVHGTRSDDPARRD